MTLEGDLAGYTGTENYYATIMKSVVYTDGVKALAEQAQASWLIELIMSYQPQLRNIPFQLWTIENHGGKGVAYCQEDTDTPKIVEQKLPYTDFPQPKYQLYCVDSTCGDRAVKVIMLKSEY